jgi:NOL1/NOP2/sun family putative RNA methylase
MENREREGGRGTMEVRRKIEWRRGGVNEAREVAAEYGYAEYMIERYIQFIGLQDTVQLLKANERPLNPTIQVNTLQIQRNGLQRRLEEKEFVLEPIPYLKRGLKIMHTPFSVGATTEYLLGYYTLQGAASMVVGESLGPHAGERVVDLCAAPGMKTIQLAQDMQNQGSILAIDRSVRRLRALEANLARCGVKNVVGVEFDARRFPQLRYPADKVLLDAPCTGSGIIRKDPRRKRSRRLADIQQMSRIQKQLIEAGIEGLREEGLLVYSTCSLEPEENEAVIAHALVTCPVELVEPPTQMGEPCLILPKWEDQQKELKKTRRFWPQRQDTEGFFIGVLRKCAR